MLVVLEQISYLNKLNDGDADGDCMADRLVTLFSAAVAVETIDSTE